jgi:glucose/mannose-6-phosphate isomerase
MTSLDDLESIARVDAHATRDVLAAFPRQCRDAISLDPDRPVVAKRPRVVVIAGMGGSAASADLIAACAADRADVPIVVHRDYGLPAVATPESLVVATSYSGDTEEVVSALEAAIARRIPAVAVTAGGRLGQLAGAHGIARTIVPGGLMPRMAIGYLFFPTRAALRGVGVEIASDADIVEALDELTMLGTEVAPDRPTRVNVAKQLALAIGDRVPVFYGGPDTAAVAYRWKTDVEENAKGFALAGALPEMNHNEIEAWRAPFAHGLQLVLLRDRDEAPEIARRFRILCDLVGAAPGGLSEASTRGKGRLARLLSLVSLGQWTSYYLALLRGVDPWSVPLLDELKRRMRTPAP